MSDHPNAQISKISLLAPAVADIFLAGLGFGVWEGLQSMGNGCGLEMEGVSTHFYPYGSLFSNFPDFVNLHLASFSVVPRCSGKVPGPSKSVLNVPGPCENLLWWYDEASGRSRDPPRVP